MSHYQKFKTNSRCVGGKHNSGTNNIYGDTTPKGTKLLKGTCTICRRNKSMIVSDNTIEAEGLKDFFKGVGKAAKSFGKKVINNPGRALEIAATVGQAAASRKPSQALAATSDILKFAQTGKGLAKGQQAKPGLQKVGSVHGRGLYLAPRRQAGKA